MSLIASLGLLLTFWTGQSGVRPAFAREGDRVEQEFVAYGDKLAGFFGSLRGLVEQQSASTTASLPRLQLQDAPPAAARSGFGVLPRIIDAAPGASQVSVFSYSWPIVEGYIEGELVKLDQAQSALDEASHAPADEKTKLISNLILEYRKLLTNQRTIDQYIQYNQFWQRSIAQDRARFDQLTRVYELMKSDEPDTSRAIQEVLGKPDVPSFISVDQSKPDFVILRVPVFTDIEDEEFLVKAKSVIEDMWQAKDGDTAYFLQIEMKKVPPVPHRGDRIDVRSHAAGFPEGGAVLTTGAQTTHSLVGRYVALAPGDLSGRTLAHEFGHVLGFRDGYIRGYRDLGERGFEILELTSVFDDIMSAPREGHVQAAHFKLLVEGMKVK
jgi:hypothetical protein